MTSERSFGFFRASLTGGFSVFPQEETNIANNTGRKNLGNFMELF
jgi:hypothetical protein